VQEVRVTGLRELARELGRVDPRLRKQLGQEYRRLSELLAHKAGIRIRTGAKGRGGSFGVRRYRPSASTTSGRVIIAGANPRGAGDEFGSRAFKQFRPWRGNQWTNWPDGSIGYGLLPVIREQEETIKQGFLDAVEASLTKAYPERG